MCVFFIMLLFVVIYFVTVKVNIYNMTPPSYLPLLNAHIFSKSEDLCCSSSVDVGTDREFHTQP